MKGFGSWILVLCGLTLPGLVLGQEPYGHVQVEQGSLVLLRGLGETKVAALAKPVEVQMDDLLRVGPDSQATLTTKEGTRLDLGANSLFQIRPWKLGSKRGYLKMVYGKAQFSQVKINPNQPPFQVRTAMAVIGVKGTRWQQEVTSEGNSQVLTQEGRVGVQGLSGEEQVVGSGQISLVLGGQPASPTKNAPALPPKGVAGLAAPAPNSDEASDFSSESALVESGVVDVKTLADSKQTEVGLGDSLEGSPVLEIKPAEREDAEFDRSYEATESDQRSEANFPPVAPPPIEIPPGATSSDPGTDGVQQNLEKSGKINLGFEK
ncbi:MAG: hypothetical protein A2600_05480 [Candidatus Lambdaproteobacteria bacterium RIFOXYD1_FULL_56_27]|uniref:FecR protein domain-containing protein n=1 Tax=Candidatus Lambdaproteobacteria bacterium RIFOXYD2_FULL_56_26 TaxID=1817773 RepID=A0A1F6GR96_9PROT|nr:MAG: hypothetical protein A2426_10690 [Candidatus Lambdaproteobacteria bacterium RIFOXYC1_FULL_56_13]OGH00652.1 MAG: hypothetical protein A2557_03185 [Candidatus Lambdaproteobacteria bacterium RIFOXYD2_FULL_56_26]OGH07819.1 MAG: hypothetical protein A2600_05480 [Candidatus Lambdaproteobacteria bacterium RIFOXYD1_FULL_56_27]